MLANALSGKGRMVMPGLRSLRATVRLPVMLCAVLVVLLMALYVQIAYLEFKSSSAPLLDEYYAGRAVPNPELRATRALHRIPMVVKRIPLTQMSPAPNSTKNRRDPVAPPPPPPAKGGEGPRKDAVPPKADPRPPFDRKLAGNEGQAVQLYINDSLPMSDAEISALSLVLEKRIAAAGKGHGFVGTRPCSVLAAMNNARGTCKDESCPRSFHPSAEHRVRELLQPYMRPTAEQRRVVDDVARTVRKKRYIFVTTASSNHFNESQALVYSLSQNVFPLLNPDSYDFYYFDLGLKAWERRLVEKNCGCAVRSFPIASLPRHARHLMCYAWKPVIIKALLKKAEVIVYMDTSIRFQPGMNLDNFFGAARKWGAQFLASLDAIPNHTVNVTFGYYGDPPCMYWPYSELLAGFSVFSNEPFMNRVVLDPWLACAFNATCMCPVHPHAFRICPHVERRVGQCHRFDLSSLTVQMAKLYGESIGHLVLRGKYRPKVDRHDSMAYFRN